MDAVIVDVGGVLLVPHFDSVGTAFAPFGISLDEEGALRAHYFGVHAMDEAGDDERQARRAYLVGYAEALRVPPEQGVAAVERMSTAMSQPNIDVWRQLVRGSRDGLRQLRAAGLKLGIVSNSDGTIEDQLRRHEICQIGEGLGVPVLAIIDSGVVGVSKPAAGIFRHALEPLDVPPERALYVGDTVRYDVRGARAAGLVPVHFDPYELCADREDHGHITSLAEAATQSRAMS